MIRCSVLAATCFFAAVASAHPAMTGDDTAMRAAPSAHARVVQDIPARAQIDVGECGERWCAASWRNMDGFVRVEAIAPNDEPLRAPAPPPPVVVGGPIIVGPAFGYGYYWHRRW
jgi:uncharacterized protein YraI